MNNSYIFKTKRLIIRQFNHSRTDFFDMMGNTNVMNPIPLKALSQEESDKKLNKIIRFNIK